MREPGFVRSEKSLINRVVLAFVVLALIAAACGGSGTDSTTTTSAATTTTGGDTPTTGGETTTTEPEVVEGSLTLVTNNAFSTVAYLLDPFGAETGVELELLAGGDVGAMVNQAILTKDNPLGDVLYGFDNTFLSRLLDADVFEPYESPMAANLPPEFQIDPEHRVTVVDFGDVCINYDKAYFADNNLAVPESLEDLRKPDYKGLLVVQNPATSSPGLAFMLATIAEYGEDGWLSYWEDLAANEVEVVPGWEEAYYTSWTLYGGQQPLVVSYASSPPAEVIFGDPVPDEAPSGVMESSCFRQIEFIGILKGTDNLPAAKALVDWWLTDAMQAELPLNYFVFPAITDTVLPSEFVEFTSIPENPYTLPPDEIAENRDRWLEEWTSTVLR